MCTCGREHAFIEAADALVSEGLRQRGGWGGELPGLHAQFDGVQRMADDDAGAAADDTTHDVHPPGDLLVRHAARLRCSWC